MLALRRGDRIPGGKPVDRQIVVGIGELRAGLTRSRCLARMRIGIPRRLGDLAEFALQACRSCGSWNCALKRVLNSVSSSFGLGMPSRGFGTCGARASSSVIVVSGLNVRQSVERGLRSVPPSRPLASFRQRQQFVLTPPMEVWREEQARRSR